MTDQLTDFWQTFGESIAKLEHENRQMLKEILKVMNGPGDVDHFHKKALATHTSR